MAGRSRPTVLLVARREILIRLRSRVFTAGTIVMVAAVVVGIWIASVIGGPSSEPAALRVGFSGGSQALASPFATTAQALGVTVTVSDVIDEAEGRSEVLAGTLDMAVSGSATSPAAVANDKVPTMAEIALDAAAQIARLKAAGLPPTTVESIMAPVAVEQVTPTNAGTPEWSANTLAGLSVAILLYISLGLYGSLVSQGVVEEKVNRIMEILLATVRPADLLGGKVLGIGLVAILQLAIVGVAALFAVQVTHLVSIPALSAGSILGYFAWFVLGFFFYAAAYATAAPLVSRPDEVASVTAPISILLVAGYLLVFVALADPTRPLVTFLSLLPPFAPVLMSMRIAAGVADPWQIALAMILALASIVGLLWLAGRIYANAALHTGRRIRFLDALHG